MLETIEKLIHRLQEEEENSTIAAEEVALENDLDEEDFEDEATLAFRKLTAEDREQRMRQEEELIDIVVVEENQLGEYVEGKE